MKLRRRHIYAAGLLASLAFAPCAFAQGEAAPFTFTTPVSLSHLHKDLTQVRTRCWVFATDNWQAYSGAIAEAASDPLPTTVEGEFRSFNGEIDLQILPQNIKGDPNQARSYRCQVELFEAPKQTWVAANELDLHYPIDRSSIAVPEAGGRLDR